MAQITERRTETRPHRLPPLILHPFSDQAASTRFLEGSRASLMLNGLLPSEGVAGEELAARILRSRFLEIRMLYFVGKDLARWIEQSVESVQRDRDFDAAGIREQSFAHLLTHHAPAAVGAKLRNWGVHDFQSIFARALGLNHAFAQPPEFSWFTTDFIFDYHRYADFLFACFQQLKPFTELAAGAYEFDLYGSGEYARMLEEEWAASGGEEAPPD